MADYGRIETHRSCHIPCTSDNGHRPPLPKISRATAASAAAAEDHDDSSNKRRMTDDDESQCRRNCLGTRNRSERHQLVGLQTIETNELEQTHEITATAATTTEECPCERITLELEDWSTCLIEDQRRSCGAGTRYRRRKCIVTSTGQLAPLRSVAKNKFEHPTTSLLSSSPLVLSE